MNASESGDPSTLILLPWAADIRFSYERLIKQSFPRLQVQTVATLSEAREKIAGADIFMAFGAAVTEDIFAEAKRLKWVQAFGTGLDGINDQPGLSAGVVVTSTRGIHGAPLSELAILHMLALARDYPRSVRAHDGHRWDRFRASLLQGKRAGILGVGLIAEALAPRLAALGMTVVGISRTSRDVPGFHAWRARSDLASAVRDLDFLILLLPYEDGTKHIIDERILGEMKPGAYIINIARGGVIDEKALTRALENGRLGGAALDTVQTEPLPADDPLWNAPNLIITPHLGGFYDTYPEDSFDQIRHNIRCFLDQDFGSMMNLERAP